MTMSEQFLWCMVGWAVLSIVSAAIVVWWRRRAARKQLLRGGVHPIPQDVWKKKK